MKTSTITQPAIQPVLSSLESDIKLLSLKLMSRQTENLYYLKTQKPISDQPYSTQ